MNKKLSAFFSVFRRASLARRLILSTILVVAATVVLGGLPAIVAIWLQLDQQVWLRVQGAQAATQALYDAGRDRLAGAATLVAERPTLCTLLQRQDIPALDAYLEVLRQNANVGALFVITPEGQSVARAQAGMPSPDVLLAGRELPFADFVAQENPPRLLIVAAQQVQPPEGCNVKSGGVVIVANELDNAFMKTLAVQTGLEQNLIVAEQRVATSLFQLPDWPLDLEAAARVVQSGTACCTRGSSEGEEYYLGLAPLTDGRGEVVAISEVALPGRSIRAGMWHTIIFLFGVGFLAALGGSMLAVFITGRVTRPLTRLAEAAERMEAGDLDTPVPVDSSLAELKKLAGQLDRARRHIRETLRITQHEMKHIERLLGAIREGVVALDESGRVTFFNPDAEQILGYRAPAVMQAHFTRVFRPAPGETITMREVLHPLDGAPPPARVTLLDAQDRPITLAVSTSWLETDTQSDRQREHVLILRDIGEEEIVNRLRANFLANVAHEFRTPLTGITSTVELLREAGPTLTPEELAKLVNTINLSTLRLQTLLDNLLESATIEAGCFRVRRRPMHIQDVIENAVETMAPLLKRRNQNFEMEVAQGLSLLWADPDRLTQVLVNLLANASKFSPMGAALMLSVRQAEDQLTIAVLDSGPGLPVSRFADLFKRFVTGDQPQGAQYGIGLGLSVVKTIVEAHGGQVGAENRSEGGAKVWFTLPIHPPKEDENQ